MTAKVLAGWSEAEEGRGDGVKRVCLGGVVDLLRPNIGVEERMELSVRVYCA